MPSNAKRLNAGIRRSRIALFSLLVPLLAFSLPTFADATQSTLRLVYIVLGFSLIIFLHELGHFVVARLCSVKCLAFSIGIGPRLCGWRKNAGFSFGPDPYDADSGDGKPGTEKANVTADNLDKPQVPQHHQVNPNESDLQTTAREPLHPSSIGNCDYRVSWLPLGGYVRMLGQDDMDPTKVSTDPHAFNQRPIWQRMCIVSAGVVMNVIFAAVAFSIIFHPAIGVEFPAAIVGAVYKDMPAAAANMHMGDEIIAINGVKPLGKLEFVDLQMAAALSDGTTPITLLVRPYGTHGEADHDVSVTPKPSDTTKLLSIGVESLPGLKIAGSGEDYIDPDAAAHPSPDGIYEKNLPELEKIRKGDKIAAVDGIKLAGAEPYMQLYQFVQNQQGKAVTLTLDNVKKPSEPAQTITLLPHLEPTWGEQDYPSVLGIAPRTIIDEPMDKSPAAGKLKEGDTIVRIGAAMYPTPKDVQRIVGASKGEPLEIAVERGGTPATTAPAGTDTATYTLSAKNDGGKWFIGVPLRQDVKDTSFIPPANPDSPLAGLPHDARITAIDGTPVTTWLDIYGALRTKSAGAAIPVTFATGSTSQTIPLTLSADDLSKLTSDLHYQLGLHLEFEMINQHGKNPAEAVMLGLDHTKKFILQVYMTLYGLFRGTVSPSNLHGIVGITKVGYDVQERGPVWLWYVLAMVSVNLAVANFLPLPIVDGGLFLLLILEKIRGKPLSLKVQSAIQVVGVVLLIGLFLFVTYNDLSLFHK